MHWTRTWNTQRNWKDKPNVDHYIRGLVSCQTNCSFVLRSSWSGFLFTYSFRCRRRNNMRRWMSSWPCRILSHSVTTFIMVFVGVIIISWVFYLLWDKKEDIWFHLMVLVIFCECNILINNIFLWSENRKPATQHFRSTWMKIHHLYKVKIPTNVSALKKHDILAQLKFSLTEINRSVPDTPTSLSKISRDSKESTPVLVNTNDIKQQTSSTPSPPLPLSMQSQQQPNAERRPLQRDNSQESDKDAIETERRAPVVSFSTNFYNLFIKLSLCSLYYRFLRLSKRKKVLHHCHHLRRRRHRRRHHRHLRMLHHWHRQILHETKSQRKKAHKHCHRKQRLRRRHLRNKTVPYLQHRRMLQMFKWPLALNWSNQFQAKTKLSSNSNKRQHLRWVKAPIQRK